MVYYSPNCPDFYSYVQYLSNNDSFRCHGCAMAYLQPCKKRKKNRNKKESKVPQSWRNIFLMIFSLSFMLHFTLLVLSWAIKPNQQLMACALDSYCSRATILEQEYYGFSHVTTLSKNMSDWTLRHIEMVCALPDAETWPLKLGQ